jgi:hypothetical protein
MNRSLNTLLPIAVVAGSLTGCVADTALRSELDERGQTWVSFDAPVTLARPAPRYSHAARDYLYLAPVETSTNGVRRHYLWIALGTTLDREWSSAPPPAGATLLLTLDGLPLTLTLVEWAVGSGERLYSVPTPPYEVRRASVSLDELSRIAVASTIEAAVVAADGSVATYDLWDGRWADWEGFLAGVDPAGALRNAEVLGNAR